MRSEDEIRTLVRERYGAIAQTAGSCCAPSSCGCGSPEMAPDGLDVIGDAYAGVAGRLEEADLHLGCGVPTRHAALRAATMHTAIQATCSHENGCSRQASSAPVSANGSANTEWLNRTNEK